MKHWRGQPDNWTWAPSRREKGRFWLGFAGVFYVLAILASTDPETRTPNGRWSWLHSVFANAFGQNSDIIVFAILGSACVAASLYHFNSRN